MNNLLTKTKADYYSHMVSDTGNNQQRLYRIVNRLLHRKGQRVLPDHTSSAETAKLFSEYFSGKIENICRELSACRDADGCVDNNTSRGFTSELSSFNTPPMEVIKQIITDASPKSCDLDPAPTWLVVESVDELLPILSRIITTSLQSSTVPDKFKIGYISPLIKKPGLNSESLHNYRPVQHLSFVSKVIERVVAQQLTSHMRENNLHEQMQSAYRQNHSTETALLKVHSDILSAVDNGCVVVLVLLDLTAAFDTIDHAILLSRLRHRFGVTGAALDWLRSYLANRKQLVRIGSDNSSPYSAVRNTSGIRSWSVAFYRIYYTTRRPHQEIRFIIPPIRR